MSLTQVKCGFLQKKEKKKSEFNCTFLPSLDHCRSGRDTVKITFSWPFLCYCQISFWINTICLMYECEIYKMLDTYFINTMSLQNVNSIVLLYYKFLFTQILILLKMSCYEWGHGQNSSSSIRFFGGKLNNINFSTSRTIKNTPELRTGVNAIFFSLALSRKKAAYSTLLETLL